MYQKFKQLGKESVIYGIGGVISKFIGFLLLPVYTRVFAPADYGVMDVIATMTALAGIILTAGTETALSYYFYQSEDQDNRRITVTTTGVYLVVINLIIVVIGWFIGGQISKLIFGNEEYVFFFRIAILSIPFSSFVTHNLNVLRLQRRPWTYLLLSIPQLFFSLILNIYFVVILRIGIIGVFWTNLISALLFSLIGLFINRSYFGKAFSWARLKQLLQYGLPLVISGLSMWVINYADRYFLLHYSTLGQVGLYGVGVRLASIIAFVTQAFRTANAPFQFETASDRDAPKIYSLTLSYYILLASLFSVFISLFARPALMILSTTAYLDAYKVVAFAAFSAVAYGLYQIVGVGLLVTKHTGFTGIAIGLGAVVNVIYLFLLVPLLGIVGAAIAVLLTHITVVVILYIRAQQIYPIPFELPRVFRILLTSGAIITLDFMLNFHGFWMDVFVGFVLFLVFIASISIFSLIEPREQQIILDRIRKVLKKSASITT
jgi:O-antigen/teichoic acid export membrane protein